jgi:phosphoribosylamine---glycine ligase
VKVLVIGSGGREHTITWKLKQSPGVRHIYCAPGNPGTASLGENVPIAADDLAGLLAFVRNNDVDLTVPGPEVPLVNGIVDLFEEAGLAIVGPSAKAAQLEGSKVFTKQFLEKYEIPTAKYKVFDNAEEAEKELNAGVFNFPTVIKADGLAAGKGVIICPDKEEALAAVSSIMKDRVFGDSGNRIVVEEFLVGEEASFMAFCDGKSFLPMVPSQDHKAVFEGDKGPNTGGMGAFSADFILNPEQKAFVLEEIIIPTMRGMSAEGYPFKGILYAGLMFTADGPKVLEYNVRFGDPETQVILPRLKSDLAEIFMKTALGELDTCEIEWLDNCAVCVVAASEGYPGSYSKGREIKGIDEAEKLPDTVVFHAGTTETDGILKTSGGRVLGITAVASGLEEAIDKTYAAVDKINFEGMYCRRDIAAKGIRKLMEIGK